MAKANEKNFHSRTIKHSSISPIKKSFDFYKTSDNLWNSRYLASPKILRYYHNSNDAYLAGPNSPLNLSVRASKQYTKTYLKKAVTQVKKAKVRLHQLRLQREYVISIQVQHASKQVTSETNFSEILTNKPLRDSPVHVNNWENLYNVPMDRLQSILPAKVIEKDLQGVENILNRNQRMEKEAEMNEDQVQVRRLQERLSTIQKHNFCRDLEQKAGIDKVREELGSAGVFGNMKFYNVSKRIHELSLPRKIRVGNMLEKMEFRGLIHADYQDIVSRISKGVGSNMMKKETGQILDRCEVEEAISEINSFEKKFYMKNDTKIESC